MPRRRLALEILWFGLLPLAIGCSKGDPRAACPVFHACGGNVDGSWAISGSCVEGNLTAMANLNPKLPVACQGMYQNVTGVMRGTVTFDGADNAHVDTTLTVSYAITINSECAADRAVAQLDSSSCSSLGLELELLIPHDTVTCAWTDNACKCSATDEFTTKEDRTYSISGAKITYSGSSDYLEFCVDGTVMHGRQFDSTLLSTVFIDAQHQL